MYKDKNCVRPEAAFTNSDQFRDLADAIFMWGVARNITANGGATSLSQMKKLKEEVQELEDALIADDPREAMDAVGDSIVVLMQICRLAGFDMVECLQNAYNEIKDRKGTMIDGVFHKEV